MDSEMLSFCVLVVSALMGMVAGRAMFGSAGAALGLLLGVVGVVGMALFWAVRYGLTGNSRSEPKDVACNTTDWDFASDARLR